MSHFELPRRYLTTLDIHTAPLFLIIITPRTSETMNQNLPTEKGLQLSIDTIPAALTGTDEEHVENTNDAEIHGWRLYMVQLRYITQQANRG